MTDSQYSFNVTLNSSGLNTNATSNEDYTNLVATFSRGALLEELSVERIPEYTFSATFSREDIDVDALDIPVSTNGIFLFGTLLKGATGQGVPTGGTTGEVLVKRSSTNYDTEWANILFPELSYLNVTSLNCISASPNFVILGVTLTYDVLQHCRYRIKFANAITSVSASGYVYLSIGGFDAPIKYNDEYATVDNSWSANEWLDVWYFNGIWYLTTGGGSATPTGTNNLPIFINSNNSFLAIDALNTKVILDNNHEEIVRWLTTTEGVTTNVDYKLLSTTRSSDTIPIIDLNIGDPSVSGNIFDYIAYYAKNHRFNVVNGSNYVRMLDIDEEGLRDGIDWSETTGEGEETVTTNYTSKWRMMMPELTMTGSVAEGDLSLTGNLVIGHCKSDIQFQTDLDRILRWDTIKHYAATAHRFWVGTETRESGESTTTVDHRVLDITSDGLITGIDWSESSTDYLSIHGLMLPTVTKTGSVAGGDIAFTSSLQIGNDGLHSWGSTASGKYSRMWDTVTIHAKDTIEFYTREQDLELSEGVWSYKNKKEVTISQDTVTLEGELRFSAASSILTAHLEVVNVGTTEIPVYALHTSLPFYSDQEITAGGVGSGGGGGSGYTSVLYASLENETSENATRLPTAWAAKQLKSRIATLEGKTGLSDFTDDLGSTPVHTHQTYQDQIDALKNIGRFLAIWNCTTGLPLTNPTSLPYTYKTGDYFRVGAVNASSGYTHVISIAGTTPASGGLQPEYDGKSFMVTFSFINNVATQYSSLSAISAAIGTEEGLAATGNIDTTYTIYGVFAGIDAATSERMLALLDAYPLGQKMTILTENTATISSITDTVTGGVNYKPNGSSYTGVASTTVETEDVQTGWVYYYDGTTWLAQSGGAEQTVVDVQAEGTSVLNSATGIANVTKSSLGMDTWTGSSNITSLGTITTGTWQGTTIDKDYVEHQDIYALTIQKNGNTIDTYTPNDSAKTINITDVASASTLSDLKSWIESMFEKDTTSVSGTTLIKAKYALYSPYEITAGGIGSGGGGGSTFTAIRYAELDDLTIEEMSKIPTAYAANMLKSRVAALESSCPTVSWGTIGTDYIPLSVNGSSYNLLTTHQDITGKVDKEAGKGLSTNDFTTVLKTKLDGIEEGANNYTHPTATATTAAAKKVGCDELGHVVLGSTLTKSDVGLGNVENTTLSTWAGSSNITTIGTLSSLTVSGDITTGGNILTDSGKGLMYNDGTDQFSYIRFDKDSTGDTGKLLIGYGTYAKGPTRLYGTYFDFRTRTSSSEALWATINSNGLTLPSAEKVIFNGGSAASGVTPYMEYDSTNNAIHFSCAIYSDKEVTAGGIGSGGGTAGYTSVLYANISSESSESATRLPTAYTAYRLQNRIAAIENDYLTSSSTLDGTKISGTIPSSCYTDTDTWRAIVVDSSIWKTGQTSSGVLSLLSSKSLYIRTSSAGLNFDIEGVPSDSNGYTDANSCTYLLDRTTTQYTASLAVFGYVASTATNCFPVTSNANAIVDVCTYWAASEGSAHHQVGFSSNGRLYHRNKGTTTTFGGWHAMADSYVVDYAAGELTDGTHTITHDLNTSSPCVVINYVPSSTGSLRQFTLDSSATHIRWTVTDANTISFSVAGCSTYQVRIMILG